MSAEMDGEERANLYQKIGTLKIQNEAMRLPRTDAGLDAVSLQAARHIEDIFAEGHRGGRSQRLAKVQIVIRETVRTALVGGAHWRSGSDLQNETKPSEGAFEKSDYTMLDTFLRTAAATGKDQEVKALLSNNFNIILAALAIAGLPDEQTPLASTHLGNDHG